MSREGSKKEQMFIMEAIDIITIQEVYDMQNNNKKKYYKKVGKFLGSLW